MISTVLQIFTFHDHLFKIVKHTDTTEKFALEDEYGTTVELKEPYDLKELREKCAGILQGYREEMSMPGANS